jgi:glycosyltransferase involved in cell wall biosynthesis
MHSVHDALELSLLPESAWAPSAAAVPTCPESQAAKRRAGGMQIPVLHVINGEHYAGAERVQDLLAARLKDFDYAVGFATLKPGRFASQRQSQFAPLHALSMRSRFDLRPALAVASLVRAHGYRLIHTHTPRGAFVGRLAAALTGIPLVHHLHSPTVADSTHRVRNQLNAAVERWGFRRAAMVIAVSDRLADYGLRQGIQLERLRVIPNGVPTLDIAAREPLPAKSCTLGCVALFRERKGLEVLLKALAQLRSQGRDVTLRAVGSFETAAYERTIRQQVDRLQLGEHIAWVGFSSDVPAELARMDLLVLPSLFGEGMPMVILEAMAAGIPVVATRVEGVPQVIRNGLDGLLAEPGDPHDLAWQISRILDGEIDPLALRASARQRQVSHFSDRSMARATAEVYSRLLGRSS